MLLFFYVKIFTVTLFGKNINNFLQKLENKENKALGHINGILNTEEMSCNDFGLPEPHIHEIWEMDKFNLENINYSEQKFNSRVERSSTADDLTTADYDRNNKITTLQMSKKN